MKRHAMVLLLSALAFGACEGNMNDRDRDERMGERDRVGGEDEFGVRRTGTGDRDARRTQPTTTPSTPSTTPPATTPPSTTPPSGTSPGMQPSGTQPTGTQPTGTAPTGAAAGAAAGMATAQLVDPGTQKAAGTVELQAKGQDVQLKTDMQPMAGATAKTAYTVHVAKGVTDCSNKDNLMKAAGPALTTTAPGGEWKTVPSLEMQGPDSVVGKAIVLKPQAAAGQPAGADQQQVLCGVVKSASGGTTGGGMTPAGGGMTPSAGGTTGGGGMTPPSGGTTGSPTPKSK